MSFDLTNKNISETFQNVLQRTGSDNHLYDLEGNKIGDLRISGSLIAKEYIVSSSVTNITTQQLSGSTQFGDSSDDSHQFTGNITASGNISSSGTGDNYFGGTININDNKGIESTGRTSMKAGSRLTFFAGNSSQGTINFNSGSGNVTVMAIDADNNTGKVAIGVGADAGALGSKSRLNVTGDLKTTSHITASGDISSS